MNAKRKKPLTMTESLKRAIAESEESFKGLERATGVKRQSVMRFVRGEQSMRLDLADKLAEHFGLELLSTKNQKEE